MKLLAIDSSGLVATAAVYVDGIIKSMSQVNNKKTHSQTLLPMIERVLSEAEIKPEELDAVAVGEGPGSFTGLRIGAATAKGLCLAINKPIIAVSSLRMIAHNFYNCGIKENSNILICPIMDARRQQVYTAVYDSRLNIIKEPMAIGISELLDLFSENENVIFAGDGVAVFENIIKEKLGERACFAPPHLRFQNAAAVCEYANKMYEEGRYIDAKDFVPVYLRLSQAEREKIEKSRVG